MPAVLSLLPTRPVPGLIDNHASYAQKHGYRHVVVDGTHVYGERQQTLHRYHCIYQQLLALADGDLLVVLDVFTVVYQPHALEAVAQGHDSIVSRLHPGQELAISSGMILRSTTAVKEQFRALVQRLGQWAMFLPDLSTQAEGQLLNEFFPAHNFTLRQENGYFPCIQILWDSTSALDGLRGVRPLLACHTPQWQLRQGIWAPHPDYDFRYVQALLLEASQLELSPRDFLEEFDLAAQTCPKTALHLNESADIAFVSLYTPNIAGYGSIHERSLLQYCEHHGYGYHLYRDTPDFLPASVTANWAKAHLIRHHLAQHRYVLWIDADILAIHQAQGIEDLLQDRDFIVGMDHTAWAINSCVFGARNTPQMRQFFDTLCSRIESVDDKSSVYASGGDQQILHEEMTAAGMVNANYIVDAISLGTSPVYATPEHRFVHFPAQHNHHRAVSMQAWELMTKHQPSKS